MSTLQSSQSSMSKTIRIDVLPRLSDSPAHRSGKVVLPSNAPKSTSIISPIQAQDYLQFFENAYDAALITDAQGSYVTANRRMTEMLGYDLQALRTVNFWQLVSGADSGLMDTVRNSLASERFLRISAWCVRQDRSTFPAEIAANQLISAGGSFFCFFIRDETLRTQAESQLRTVQNAVKNASAGIGVAGLNGTILYANTAMSTLLGEANPKLIKGRQLETLLDNNAKLVQDLIAAVKEGQSALVELSRTFPDGSTRWIQISVAPNLDTEDALIGMVLSLVDVSDRRRAEQAERVVDRDKVMMESLGAVCHHLGQPATVLLSTLEMMSRMKDSDHDARKELLQMSLEAAESLRKILLELNDLRHYSAEPYPGPTTDRPSSILAISAPEKT